ncbi:MAG: FAD-dependent oxidoreductase [Candidatus Promineifilaceae bacterium]|nr:FAD-dependent oxidoreductase [Candidatus Promineifilaceae bacterium]
MPDLHAEIVICGAGLAGVSAAYHLAVKHGLDNVILVDERPPLTLTSDKSTECYRNWWPGPGDTMVRFMNRSIDLLEELADASDNYFGLNRRGYVFLTANEAQTERFRASAEAISDLGAGPLRVHRSGSSTYQPAPPEGYRDQPIGADLLIGGELIRQYFPFVTDDVVAMLNPRRCGWLSAQQLGMYLLDQARAHGARLIEGHVEAITVQGGRVTAVHLSPGGAVETIKTDTFVNAAGPYVQQVANMVGVQLPVFNELHGKVSINDPKRVIPRQAPMMIWSDPVRLPWTEEERAMLAADEEMAWLLEQFPAGAHFRPEGLGDSPVLLILWTYDIEPVEPIWPPRFDPSYPEIVLRGLTRMAPGLSVYLERMERPWVDGGYYCKTQENRPLIGPLGVQGAYIIGALSGYGVMACQAAGELLAAHVTGAQLPDYAASFTLERYQDPAYQALLAEWDPTTGQL